MKARQNAMNTFRFLDWQVYKDAKALFRLVHTIVKKLPPEISRDLGRDILRAAFSVAVNIAEGSGKSSDKELKRFFDISLGSLNETVAGMDILKEDGFVSREDFEAVMRNAESISKQLGGFKKRLS